jgi:hypothetical protein
MYTDAESVPIAHFSKPFFILFKDAAALLARRRVGL